MDTSQMWWCTTIPHLYIRTFYTGNQEEAELSLIKALEMVGFEFRKAQQIANPPERRAAAQFPYCGPYDRRCIGNFHPGRAGGGFKDQPYVPLTSANTRQGLPDPFTIFNGGVTRIAPLGGS
jgi:hypothetical protein